ncbi:C-type lectin domain family 4 member E [Neoarius graeffei]|uniref:C-type lectin domain family 4 member E n=1 Tax=Neoarius graeffei TaxID=443677 RepID=UPI00298D3F3F|nr:C-type lectin domain family 4 member E [Neoarius graeffei]
MEENYSSLQEFTEESHSAGGNKPILYSLHNGQADDIKRVDCMRRQTVIFLIIALLVSFCINIALTVVLFKRKPCSPHSVVSTESPLSEARIQSLKLSSLEERFSRLCSDYTTLGKTCSAQVKQCMPCPDGWKYTENKCYYFSDDKLDWIRSRESCASMDSHLAILHTHEQHLALEKIARSLSGFEYYYWIGLSDIEEEGVWKWVDNTPVNNTYWDKWDEEPNNHQSGGLHGEDCAVLNSHSKSWFDVPCDNIYKHICEMDAITVN